MKFLKIFSVLAVSAMTLNMFATETAKFVITFKSTAGFNKVVKLCENDAVGSDFSSGNNAPYEPQSGAWYVNAWVLGGGSQYSAVETNSLEGLKIYFKANEKETAYTMSFSEVDGAEYFLQQEGEDEFIPMTTDYGFTCEKSAEIIFTVVKQAAPQKDYTRDAATVIDNWYTICVPGGVDVADYSAVMDVYTVAGYNAEKGLGLNPMTEAMQPGVPYIFQAKAELIEFDYNEAEVALEPQEGANYLTGTFEAMQTANVAYVVANNKLNWAAAGTTVPAYRAYLAVEDITELPVANNAPGRKFLPAPKAMPTGLEGATVNGLQNGTYMVNGQIMIVKDGKTFNVLGL